jgi:protein-disulfide isomerase
MFPERSFALTRRLLVSVVSFLLLTLLPLPSGAQTPSGTGPSSGPSPDDSKENKPVPVEGRVEKYLRNLYAWGTDFDVKIGAPKPSPIADLLEVPVTVSKQGQSDTAVVYVSKTGKYMIRGELTDMTVDPFAGINAKLHVGASPSMGPADAKVTLIEFADFECPSCRQLDLLLRDLLPKHPEVRLVFKHYPLTDIHPWAMTAAIASQCAFQQDPAAFWKMHHAIFDAQDAITPENAWQKMVDLATQIGLSIDVYKTCTTDPATMDQVNSTIEEGHTVTITATPTTFVNGRRVVGPDRSVIEGDISFNGANN